jgi:hypothetical protein
MKIVLALTIALLLTRASIAEDTIIIAPTPRFEIGGIVGAPTGLSAKLWYGPVVATSLTAAWSFTEHGTFEMDLDFLLHPLNLQLVNKSIKFPLYFGPGFGARVGDEWFLCVRIPVGAEYIVGKIPITIFGEVVPQWQFIPDNRTVVGGGVGIRIRFGSVK